MAEGLAALDPSEAVLVIIALIGLVPVVLHYRSESKVFVVGYLLLLVAAVSTNLEALFLGDALNFLEHSAGLMGSGLALLAAGYLRRRHILGGNDEGGGAAKGDAVADTAAGAEV